MLTYPASAADSAQDLMMLTELPGVGVRTANRVLRAAGARGLSLPDVVALPAEVLAREFGLPRRAIRQLTERRPEHEEHCRRLWARLQAAGVTVARRGDGVYPERWRGRAGAAPPIVYAYGNPGVLAAPTVAVLSSRTIDGAAVTAAIEVLRRTAQEGATVVSGGMKGTYRIAAVTVRAIGAPRVIVLDRGLLACFGKDLESDPFGLGPGRARLDLTKTLVLSTFRPRDHAAPGNGRQRDELVADLADVVVAVRARPGGEIERVCLRALDAGRCVLSWHGENPALVAAGAVPIGESHLRAGLQRFFC